MAEIIKFHISINEYLRLAKEASEAGDIEKNIACLLKVLKKKPKHIDAMLMLADTYSSIGAIGISNDLLFETLSMHIDREHKQQAHLKLAMNFVDLEKPDVAEYYLRDLTEEFDFSFPDMPQLEEIGKGGYHIVYPRGEDYYQMLIEQAYDFVREQRFDDALKVLDEVDEKSPSKPVANHVALVCLMMKDDVDAVIANAEKMQQDGRDNIAVACTLATAYMMEDRLADAERVLDGVLKYEHDSAEDILMILPILVNMEKHAEIVKYTKRVLELINPQPGTMLWQSQALYNLGLREEARIAMLKVKLLFGEYTAAEYYLSLYEKEPPKVNYSIGLPYSEKMRRFKLLDDFLKATPADAYLMLESKDSETRQILEWVFRDQSDKMKFMILDRFDSIRCDFVNEFLRKQLVRGSVSFELMTRIVYLLGIDQYALKFNVVAQDRFKQVHYVYPSAFRWLPTTFHDAVSYCISDIIFTDETPTVFLHRLTAIVNSIVDIDENGKLIYSTKSREKIPKLKSMRTLVGVLLARVYADDEDDIIESTVARYGLNRRTFDKYYNLIFPGEDIEEDEN